MCTPSSAALWYYTNVIPYAPWKSIWVLWVCTQFVCSIYCRHHIMKASCSKHSQLPVFCIWPTGSWSMVWHMNLGRDKAGWQEYEWLQSDVIEQDSGFIEGLSENIVCFELWHAVIESSWVDLERLRGWEATRYFHSQWYTAGCSIDWKTKSSGAENTQNTHTRQSAILGH